MTIKQQGGIFGRNPTFNEVEASDLTVRSSVPTITIADTDTTGTHTLKASNANLDVSADPSGVQAGSGIRFFVDGDEKVKINSTGNLVISNSGKGIDFSATSGTGTSELFSDYEEGSWSPVVSDASSGGNTGAGTITGNYTKIGRTVFINFAVSNLNTTGMTSGNDLFITGLPYAVASLAGTNYFTGALVMHSVTTSGNQVAAIQDAQDYIKLYEVVSGSAFDFITVGDINSGVSDIRFSLTYEAA